VETGYLYASKDEPPTVSTRRNWTLPRQGISVRAFWNVVAVKEDSRLENGVGTADSPENSVGTADSPRGLEKVAEAPT
jgi:hypothetical protein